MEILNPQGDKAAPFDEGAISPSNQLIEIAGISFSKPKRICYTITVMMKRASYPPFSVFYPRIV